MLKSVFYLCVTFLHLLISDHSTVKERMFCLYEPSWNTRKDIYEFIYTKTVVGINKHISITTAWNMYNSKYK
jgi:hypothetical protein